MAERDVNASLVTVDDHLAKIDNEMIDVSYFIIIITIFERIVLDLVFRIRKMKSSKL